MRGVWVGGYCLAVALLFSAPLLARLSARGIIDWPETAAHYAAARQTVLGARQFPLWNPYLCGGAPALGTPQTYFLSPLFLAVLLFDPVVGPKLAVPLYLFLGGLGMWLLARRLGSSSGAALLSVPVFLTSGFLAMHLAVGQFVWLTVAYLPWVFVGYLRSARRWWWLVLGAAALALIGIEGRSYLVAYAGLFLLTVAAAADLRRRGRERALVRAGVLLLLAFLLGAWKFVPDLFFLADRAQALPDTPRIPLTLLPKMLFFRETDPLARVAGPHALTWFEYGAYLGVLPVALALTALVRRSARAALLPWVIGGGVLLLLTVSGSQSNLLEALPVTRELRNAQRAFVVVVFVTALLAARGLDELVLRLPARVRRRGTLLIAVVVAAVVADLALVTAPALTRGYPGAESGGPFSDVALEIRAREVGDEPRRLFPVFGPQTVGQTFIVPTRSVTQVELAVGEPLPPSAARIRVEARDDTAGRTVSVREVTVGEAARRPGRLAIPLRLTGRRGHRVTVTFSAPGLSSAVPLRVWHEPAGTFYPDGALVRNGALREGDLGMMLRRPLPTAVVVARWLRVHPRSAGVLVAAAAAVGAALWLGVRLSAGSHRARRALVLLLGAAGLATLLASVATLEVLGALVRPLSPPASAFSQSASSDPYAAVVGNRGAVNLCPAVILAWRPATAVRTMEYQGTYRGEAFLDGAGTATLQSFTPNALAVAVDAAAPARVVVNQNAAAGWRASPGRVGRTPDGLLAVDVPAGAFQLTLRYWPPGLTVGLVLTALATAGLLGAALWERRRSTK